MSREFVENFVKNSEGEEFVGRSSQGGLRRARGMGFAGREDCQGKGFAGEAFARGWFCRRERFCRGEGFAVGRKFYTGGVFAGGRGFAGGGSQEMVANIPPPLPSLPWEGGRLGGGVWQG